MMLLCISLGLYVVVMLVTIYFDLKKYIIPNWLTLPAIVLAVVYLIMTGVGWEDVLVRAVLSGGLFLAVGLVTSRIWGKETIGGGDIKLITLVGLYKGWQDGLAVILVSSVAALAATLMLSVLKKRKISGPVPFGFYIALCAIGMEILTRTFGGQAGSGGA